MKFLNLGEKPVGCGTPAWCWFDRSDRSDRTDRTDRSDQKVSIPCVILLFAGICLASSAWACNSGTVRDAAFAGPRDMHRLCLFADPANEEMKAAYARIEAWFKERGEDLNVEPEFVDCTPPDMNWERYGLTSAPPSLPVTILSGYSGQLRRSFVISHWEPAPTPEALDTLLGSPAITEAKKHLVEIWAVALYAPGKEKNTELEKVIEDWGQQHPPGLALARVDRNDPKEKLLVDLGELTPDGGDWLGILFARGKLKAPMLRGDDLTSENVVRQLNELTEQCTCLQESSIFGLDLPMVWEKSLDERFAALETAAGYSEVKFEQQVDKMVAAVEEERPMMWLAALAPLVALAAVSLGSVAWLVWRSRRASGGGLP